MGTVGGKVSLGGAILHQSKVRTVSAHCVYAQYDDVRGAMLPGDVIAFDGEGLVSGLVRLFAGRPSHVGIVSHAKMSVGSENALEGHVVNIIESTSLKMKGQKRFIGVQQSRLSDRLKGYAGRVYWLPLARNARRFLFNTIKAYDFALRQEHKGYDFWQVLRNAAPFHLFPVKESYNHLFCSELAAGVLKAGGMLPEHINPSTVTPADLCRFRIYEPEYVQLTGEPKSLPWYNLDAVWRNKL